MGELYGNAAHVYAYVGPHTTNSQFLVEMLDQKHDLFTSIYRDATKSGSGRVAGWVTPNPIPRSRWLALKCFLTLEPWKRSLLAAAVLDFLQRPYFSRLWVLQELYNASRSSFCCGMDIRPFDTLLAMSLLVGFWINQRRYLSCWSPITQSLVRALHRYPSIVTRMTVCDDYLETFHALEPQRSCLALTTGTQELRRLAEVMDAMQYFRCADPKDSCMIFSYWSIGGTGQHPFRNTIKIDSMLLCWCLKGISRTRGVLHCWEQRLNGRNSCMTSSKRPQRSLQCANRYRQDVLPGCARVHRQDSIALLI